MKRFLMLLMLAFVMLTGLEAQNQNILWYQSYSYSQKQYNYYTETWTDWTDWVKTKVNIKIDLNKDLITIFSNKTQYYKVIEVGEPYIDSSGGSQIKFTVIDGEYDTGKVRLRVEKNNNLQIYIDFADIMWVYNVRRIQ